MTFKLVSNSLALTFEFGKALGGFLKGGEIIGIKGELGAGKTSFTQGLACGLGIPENEYVRSPTFTIINEYKGEIPLYHFDLYRLDNLDEIINLGYEEYFSGSGVTVIEWYEKLEAIVKEGVLVLTMKILGEESRELNFSCHCVYYGQILEKFLNKVKKKGL